MLVGWLVSACLYYLYTVIFLLQRWAVLRQSQLAQPSGDRLVLHDDTYTHTHTQNLPLTHFQMEPETQRQDRSFR